MANPGAGALPTLTKPQREELQRLSREPQRTYGRARARVQNRLMQMGLAYFADMGGTCMISGAGLYWLQHAPTHRVSEGSKR